MKSVLYVSNGKSPEVNVSSCLQITALCTADSFIFLPVELSLKSQNELCWSRQELRPSGWHFNISRRKRRLGSFLWVFYSFDCLSNVITDLMWVCGCVLTAYVDGVLKARLSCGHVVTPESLTESCRAQLNEVGFYFIVKTTRSSSSARLSAALSGPRRVKAVGRHLLAMLGSETVQLTALFSFTLVFCSCGMVSLHSLFP